MCVWERSERGGWGEREIDRHTETDKDRDKEKEMTYLALRSSLPPSRDST